MCVWGGSPLSVEPQIQVSLDRTERVDKKLWEVEGDVIKGVKAGLAMAFLPLSLPLTRKVCSVN